MTATRGFWPAIPAKSAIATLLESEQCIATPGRKYMRQYLKTGRLTRSQAMCAMCAQCTCYYDDGRRDCEIPTCPLYPWMPYRKRRNTP